MIVSKSVTIKFVRYMQFVSSTQLYTTCPNKSFHKIYYINFSKKKVYKHIIKLPIIFTAFLLTKQNKKKYILLLS